MIRRLSLTRSPTSDHSPRQTGESMQSHRRCCEVCPTSMPSLRCSPWSEEGYRGSAGSWRASAGKFRVSPSVCCRRHRDFDRQNQRNPARYKRITVSGCTITKAFYTARRNPIEAGKIQTFETAGSEPFRRFTSQHIVLVAQRQAPASSETLDRNRPMMAHRISRWRGASPDSWLHPCRMEFTVGTPSGNSLDNY